MAALFPRGGPGAEDQLERSLFPMRQALRRLRTLIGRKRVEREMDEEMRFHLEMEIEERVRSGMSRAEARRSAQRDFGGVEQFKEEARDVRGLGAIEMLAHDARFAMRTLRRNPGFALVTVLTLALGVGANTAVFSVVDATLLRPLPYSGSDRIVLFHELSEEGQEMAVSGGNFVDWQEMSRSFEASALYWNPDFVPLQTILGADTAVRTRVSGVSKDFFRVMGVAPERGRGFAPEETRKGGAPVAAVSRGFWRAHLGEDPEVLGRPLDIGGESHQIVAVMPEGFDFPAETDLWVAIERHGLTLERTAHNYAAIGRLRSGTSLADAERELSAITSSLKQQHGSDMDAVGARLERLQDSLVGNLRRPLVVLLGASLLVLLVACTNLASIFLARGAARDRELAVRTVLGASRTRLMRQLLTESMVLSLFGAAAGIGLAAVVLRGLLAVGPESLAVAGSLGVDGRVLAFALLLAVATTILFGVIPAVRSESRDFGDVLRSGTRGNAGGTRSRVWGILIGTEVAIAIVLLIGSGLLLRSFRELLAVDAGFDPAQVLTVDVSLPESRYSTDPLKASYYQRLLEELARIPAVEAAGLVQHLPLGGLAHNGSFDVEGRGDTHEAGIYPGYRVASEGYFEAMGIPLLRGRLFGEGDSQGTPDVAVINRALADQVWPGEDPIGKRVRNLANDSWIYPDRWVTIVGIVGNVRHGALLEEAQPEIYVHYLQRPNRAQSSVLVLRSALPTPRIIEAARDRIQALDAEVPMRFVTMRERVIGSVADRRFTMLVLGAFSLVALLLAAVGIYGVVSYSVARRTREIGIRMALGAEAGNVRALVQRRVMLTAWSGTAVGIVGALLLSRAMQGLLYGVTSTDPWTFLAVTLGLTGVAWLASYVPSRRTARVDPMIAMRAE